jgi:hypothetical protein
LFLATLLLATLSPLSASVVHKTKQFGEPRPDKALVYVVREKAFVGGGVGIFVFADEQLIAFVRNNTYGFGFVDPGPRLLWGDTPQSLEVHLIAGETYYVEAKPVNPITLLTEEEGKKAIEKVGAYIESDQKDLDNAAKKIAKRYEKVQAREAKKQKADVEEIATVAAIPAEGALQLPANTKIAIELMENVSSSLAKLGETVWFRVTEDVLSGESVLIPRGARVKATVRQARSGRSFGDQGTLDIALVSIDLDDERRIPLIGQLAAAGDQRAAGMMTGILVGAFIKGTEAFHTAGTKFSAWTRDDVWLAPAVQSVASAHAGVTAPEREFVLGANTRRNPGAVQLSFSRANDTCTAHFTGWSVLRHIRPSETAQALHLHGKSGEQEIHVDIPTRMKVE